MNKKGNTEKAKRGMDEQNWTGSQQNMIHFERG